MRWPGPDVGRVAFPASDTRTVIFPGSAREMVAFPPAPMFVVPIDAAASGAGTATAVLVTTPVYPMDVTGLGTASAVVIATVTISATVSSEGAAVATFAELIEATASGVGTAGVTVKPSVTFTSDISSTGIVTATITPGAKIVAATFCEGLPSVGAWPAATVNIAASGSGTPVAIVTAISDVPYPGLDVYPSTDLYPGE